MKGDMATAVRKAAIVTIAAEELREGDIVLLQTGDIVPADLKLIEAWDLEVDEFDLTGEIMPVAKRVRPEADVLALRGSNVLRGHGKGLVIATGEDTEYGKILDQAVQYAKAEAVPVIKKTHLPLLVLLLPSFLVSLKSHDGHLLVYAVYGLLALLLLLLQNAALWRSALLRSRRKRLSQSGILVAHDRVLEAMDKVDVVCFDKTGVLTTRDIRISEMIHLGGEDSSVDRIRNHETWDLLMTGCALCHDLTYYETVERANPVDRALISFAEDHGLNIGESVRRFQKIDQKPFSSEDRFATCGFHDSGSGKRIYFAKGDPEVLLTMCQCYATLTGEEIPCGFSFLSTVRTKIAEMSNDGSVVIALAYGSSPFIKQKRHHTFLCLLQLRNPIKSGAEVLLSRLHEWGIRSVILTGDRTETARAIGEAIGVGNAGRSCLTGRHIEKMTLDEVGRQSEFVSIFARLLPSQKALIVRILQQKGHRVVMVGDGTNDALALKAADVGFSFIERSSPLAKKAAQILVRDITDILPVLEAARSVRRQAGWIAPAITALFLLILLGDSLWSGPKINLRDMLP